MDDNGNRRLSKVEFNKAMHDIGITISGPEIDTLFAHFDTTHENDGCISFDEFLHALRVSACYATQSVSLKALLVCGRRVS